MSTLTTDVRAAVRGLHRTPLYFMRRAMGLASLGLAVGLAASWGASGLLRGLGFGISTTDPLTFLSLAALVAVICAAASYFPARRASRLDPVRALRAA